MRDAERTTNRPGQERDPDDAGLLDAFEHSRRERALEHLQLELQAVNEERGEERLEALHSDCVPDPRIADPELRLPDANVLDDPLLPLDLRAPPGGNELDSH
jgi:hypothetical protein